MRAVYSGRRPGRSDMLVDFFGHDAEALHGVRSEGGRNRHIGRVTASGNEHASDSRNVVARIEGMPAATEVDLHPGGKIHGAVGRRNSDVTQVAGAVACGNVHAAAESDGQVGEVATDSGALVECLEGRLGHARMLVTESDVVVDVVADRLDARPSGRRRLEQV